MAHILSLAIDVVCAILVVCSFGYGVYRTFSKSEDPARLAFRWLITFAIGGAGYYYLRSIPLPYLPAFAAVFAVIIGVIWAPSIGGFVASPLTGMFDGGHIEPDKKPMYSYAQARREKGLTREALDEVLKELAKFPEDFTGVLLLASIYAEDLKDLPSAEKAIEEFLSQKNLPPHVVATALQNLADLQWRFGQGAATPTATLQRIVDAFPDTHFAHAALQRIAHLELAQQTRQQRAEVRYEVKPGEKDIGLRARNSPARAEPDGTDEMERLVQQLERHPFDAESREKLALMYADQAGRVDLAAEQLEQLIALKTESPRHIARWLNLLATVHARFGNDLASAESALHRIQERFPKSTMADAALTRLASLNLEVKSHGQTAAKTIGSYAKDIGLRK